MSRTPPLLSLRSLLRGIGWVGLLGAASPAAWAGGLHAGIPVEGLAVLGEPSFVSPSAGWTAPTLQGNSGSGMVRVFVGPTEAAAAAWYTDVLQRGLTLPPPVTPGPLPVGIDAAHGDGEGLWLFRDGNVAVLVRTPVGARALGEQLHARIVDVGGPWPSPPTLQQDAQGHWVIQTPAIAHVQFEGGALLPTRSGWVFSSPPTGLVVWDTFGRPAVWGDWQD